MEQQPNLTDKTTKKQRGKPFVKDDPRINREGRPEGSKNFTTLMDETIKEIARLNNISEQEAWKVLTKRAYSEAKDGSYQYYQDIINRYYGKIEDKIDLNAKIQKITDPEERKELAQIFDDAIKRYYSR